MKQDVQPDGELRYCMKPFWFPGTNFLTMNIWEISKSLQIPKYFCWWHWKVANLMLEDWLSTGSKFWSNRNTWTKWGDYKQLLLLNIQRDEFCVWKLRLTTKSRINRGLCDLRPPLMFHSTERSDLSKRAGKKYPELWNRLDTVQLTHKIAQMRLYSLARPCSGVSPGFKAKARNKRIRPSGFWKL